jgi:FAD binding domain
MNTGIVEAHDLAARLAAICRNGADEATLDGYEKDCRPVALANADESLENALRLSLVSDVLGPHQTLPSLDGRLETLTDVERRSLADAIDQQWSHFMSDGTFPPSIHAFIVQAASSR